MSQERTTNKGPKKPISEAEFFEFQRATADLAQFVERVSRDNPPHYHSFLRTLVNSMQPMLGVAMLLSAGGDFEAKCRVFGEARGASVIPSRASQPPQFADYLHSALEQSRLDDTRKTFWRNYFDGVRILRNKSAHYDSSFADHERETLSRVGLGHHVGDTGHMQTRPANFLEMLTNAHEFIRELDAA